MIRNMRAFMMAGAAALLGMALLAGPAALAPALAQTQPSAKAPAKAAPAPKKATKATKAAPAAAAQKTAAAPAAKKAGIPRRGVEIVQAALNNAGYKLDIDGAMNKATRDALKKYQAEHKLKATGGIDKATLKSLNIKSLKKWS